MASSFFDGFRSGEGFTAEVTCAEARRQLRISVGLVAMLSIGIVSAAATVGTYPIPARRTVASMAPTVVLHAETAAVGAAAI